MRNNLMKVPIISLITGVILTIADYTLGYFIAKGSSEWTLEMNDTVIYTTLCLSIILFISTGFLFLRNTLKKDILKSATLVVVYNIVLIVLEQVILYFGTYSITIHYLFIPVRMYGTITQVLLNATDTLASIWISTLPAIIAPYLYVIFGKRYKDVSNI